jgi:hypothetical protein
MYKWLAILLLLCQSATIGILTSQEAQIGTAKQGIAKSNGSLDRKKETTSQNEDENARKMPTVVVQVQAPQSDTESAERQDDRQIQRQLALYTGLLVVVGALQFAALAGTLWIVRRQAAIMDRQTGIMTTHAGHLENLAVAADASSESTGKTLLEIQRQANLMETQGKLAEKTIVLQFRPRIVVRNARATGLGMEPGKPGICTMESQLVNVGGSPAHIVGGFVSLFSYIAKDARDLQFIDGSKFEISKGTLQPGERSDFEKSMETGTINDSGWMDYYVGKGSGRNLILTGTIWYNDDIGIRRQTSIYRPYDPNTGRFSPKDNSVEQENSD